MRIKLRGHNYDTAIKSAILTRLDKWFGSCRNPCNMWISHADGCCGYWQPATPEDFMLDDGFRIKKEGHHNE